MLREKASKNGQILIALSGRKAAGKNTTATFLGKYYAQKVWKPEDHDFPNIARNLDNLIGKAVFECSFADKLKEFCIETLGLIYEQCYGTDDEKNAPTQYGWEDAPDFLRWKFGDEFARKLVAKGKTQNQLVDELYKVKLAKVAEAKYGSDYPPDMRRPDPVYMTGKMTGREIMQIVGTDLNRQTFGNIWAAATIRNIKKQGKALSLITDNRFPNEIQAVLDQPQGYIIRLTRSPFGVEDAHPSESALDGYDWNRPKCFVLDNAEMTIAEQNEAVKPIFHQILGA